MKFANRFTYSLNYNRYGFSYSLIGIILPFSGPSNTIPYGWYECNGLALSRLDYSKLFSIIGTTYGSGDGHNTFNIPDFRNKTFWGRESSGALGQVRTSGLPNITGRSSAPCSPYANFPLSSIVQGAFYAGNQFYSNTRSGSDVEHNYVHFDASRSNAIYGKSSIVQPPAVVVNFIIKAI